MACDPQQAITYAREMYVRRKFQPWAAYNSGAWKSKIPRATVGVANMLRERYGVPLIA
jgi:hypothetical protein